VVVEDLEIDGELVDDEEVLDGVAEQEYRHVYLRSLHELVLSAIVSSTNWRHLRRSYVFN
jgi:hypothetical protein